jgi:hypothetical protein
LPLSLPFVKLVLKEIRGAIMGKRDYRWRERKKPKKDARKTTGVEILPSPVTVEVIKKGKKERPEEE